MNLKISTLAILIGVLLYPVSATTTGAASFTAFPASIRMQGLCGAGSALNDSAIVYANPAVLGFVPHSEVNLFQGSLLGGVNYLSIGMNSTQEYYGCTGAFQYVNASVDGFKEAYLDNGEVGLTGKQFGYNAHNYVFSLAKRLSNTLFVGTNLKYITETLYENTATGYGADLGMAYIYDQHLQLSATLRNAIAPVLTWDTVDKTQEAARTQAVFGAAYFGFNSLGLIADVYSKTDSKVGIATGLEYYLNKYVTVRCGTDLTRFTLGSSLYIEQASLHFAFAPDFESNIGNAYYFSGAYFFDVSQQAPPADILEVPVIVPIVEQQTIATENSETLPTPAVLPAKPVDDGLSTIYIYADKKADSQNVWITR